MPAVFTSPNESNRLVETRNENNFQAAGVVTIAHRSGGPAADIVVPLPDGRITGFLATTPQEYAEAMARVFDPEGDGLTVGAVRETSTSTSNCSSNSPGQDQSMSGGKGRSGVEGEGREEDKPVSLPQQQQQQGEEVGRGGGQEAAKRQGGMLSSRAVRTAGRESARRFSNAVFDRAFAVEFVELVKNRRSVFRFFPRVRSRISKED